MDGRMLLYRAVFSMLLAGCSSFAGASVVAAPRADLPTVLVEAPPGTDGPMMLLLSGDGNWAPFPRGLAEASAADGSPVLGLKSRAYMAEAKPASPQGLASDLAAAVRKQLAAWHRQSLVVVGYSRGADWAPFVVNRWPKELRSRVEAMAFVGLSDSASFEFHLEDLFRDVDRPTDIPVRPEVEKLKGMPLICVYGVEEENSFCMHPTPGMKVYEHAGGHRVKDDKQLIAYLLSELGVASQRPQSSAR